MYIIISAKEGCVKDNIEQKQKKDEQMKSRMIELTKEITKKELRKTCRISTPYDAEKEIMAKSNNLKYDFTKIWVKKEAYLKMKGTGLNFGKENVDTTKIDAKIIDYNDYLIAVCEV